MAASDPFQTGTPPAGPFSDYLRPVQPRPIDEPMAPNTGYESGPVGVGKVALGFLQGIRQNRVANMLETERNNQNALDNYRQYVNSRLQDPDLTDEGRQAILDTANRTMNEHMHYEMKDVPKDGVAGFFKNLLVNATGGPVKVREPIDWTKATGEVTQAAAGHSQNEIFSKAIQGAQQKIAALKQQIPNPTAEQVQGAIQDEVSSLAQRAPGKMGAFQTVIGVPLGANYPTAGSIQALMTQLVPPDNKPAGPVTAPPPAPPNQNYTPIAGATMFQPGSGSAAPGPAVTASAPSVEGGVPYQPGYDAKRFALLSTIAGRQGSPIQIGQPHLVTAGDRRVMATMVVGSPNPLDNGYWDASSGQKINGPVTAESISTGNGVTDEKGFEMHYDPNQGKYVYTPGPDGKPFRRGYAPVPVVGPDGNVRWVSRGESSGQISGAQGLLQQRTAADVTKSRGAALVAADARRTSRMLSINQQADAAKRGVQSRSLDILQQTLGGLGIPLDAAAINQALNTNPAQLLADIEAQRQRQLQSAQEAWGTERASVDENYPAQSTATPPVPAARTAPPPIAPSGPAVPVPPAGSSLRKR